MVDPAVYKRYAKILKAKTNRHSRNKAPLDNAIAKLFDDYDLLDEIHKKIRNRRMIQEARKQFIITAVTSIEVLLREYFIQLLNYEVIAKKFTEQLNKKEFSIEDMEVINNEGISKSELVADNYNFQNLSEINGAFSKALSNNFFKDLKEYEMWFDKKDKKKGYFKLGEFYEDLDWLIASRHDFVHDINEKVKVSKKEAEDISLFCVTFISQVGFYISEKFYQLKKSIPKS